MATTTITWAWGKHTSIAFDPATDTLDFGWMGADAITVTEVNGAVVISIPSNDQSYTLTGVSLADLSMSNITARDSATVAEWTALLSGSTSETGGSDGAGDADDGGTGDTGTGGSETGGSDSGDGTGSSDGTGTTTLIRWAWGSNAVLAFDPATDTLDFDWFSADNFSVSEVNGSVVISIPTNNQTYTLEGVTLAELSLSNIVAKDASALAEWSAALNGDTGSGDDGAGDDTGSGDTGETGDGDGTGEDDTDDTDSGDDTAYAAAWSADTVYLAGDRASVGNSVYEANWWTQGTDPAASTGSGQPWTFVGYMDTTPVVPDQVEDLRALNVTETTAVLVWDAADIEGVGTLSGYAIYQDGELVGTTTSTSYKVTGLTAGTSYDFTIVAMDEAGSSDASVPLSVTTDPLGSGSSDDQYFSPYVDMSLTTSQDLVAMVEEADLSAVTLAFVLSSGANQIGWGGIGTIENDTLSNGTTISSIVEELQMRGVEVTISFGGANGQEPALTFTDAEALTAAYQSVIDTYHVTRLDFDIEGGALADDEANAMRNEALVALQEANPDLAVSFTLPVLPTGLTQDGLDLLADAQAAGVEIDVVNIMAMDYGASVDSGDMGDDAIAAAEATIAQLEALGIDAQVAVTPMIGINDVQSEVFTLEDAQQLVDYADGNENIAYLAMWSLGRDNGDVIGSVSPVGSGLSQDDYDFAKIFDTV